MARAGLLFALVGLSPAAALRRAPPPEPVELHSVGTNVSKVTMNTVGDNIKRALEGHFNCEAYPGMCQEPLNCQRHTVFNLFQQLRNTAGKSGHADLSGLCYGPDAEPFWSTCLVQKNLVLAARLHYEQTISGKFQDGEKQANTDASFCFIEGLCKDEAVTNATTLAEAEQLCDGRYGHDEWTRVMSVGRLLQDSKMMEQMPKDGAGFEDRSQTRQVALQACAKGHFHCSAMYCKETLCRDEKYIRKFGHLAP
uniref:Uncharacterized protein n=1 Tax=Alexandrium catenella TaxID=2925 RepID=A0A7S1WY90_ALECA|mmetsp:Transcript_99346/g.264027  ORF Transcript_99346/g.264027 Transcript_99346/m.264027 type:complete len:253 (+) Transcript_99346:49-807(+)